MPALRYEQMLIVAGDGIATGQARARADVLTGDGFADGCAMKKHCGHVRVLERDRRHPLGLFEPERLSRIRFTTQRPDETRAGKKKMGVPARPPAGFLARFPEKAARQPGAGRAETGIKMAGTGAKRRPTHARRSRFRLVTRSRPGPRRV